MKPRLRALLLGTGMALVLAGCATVQESPGLAQRSALEPLIAPHRERAAALAGQGNLREALDEWNIALTIDPKDALSLDEKQKLDTRIQQTVSHDLSLGREALKRKVYLEARRYFLAVLAVDPANKEAFAALQNEVRETRLLNHTVRKGETLASIAQFYYGDRSRLEVIWETNQLPPNPKLTPGMVLKIPEIPGVPFLPREAARPRPAPAEPPAESPRGEVVEQEEVPLLADAREALERKEFSLALANVDKFLAQNPRNAEGAEIKKSALYQQGKFMFEQKKYEESFEALTQLAKLSPNYQDASVLLGRARGQLAQEHYNQGIRLYRDEKLNQAIAEWRKVLNYDPSHAAAKKNIEQAERLLKGLQERQQKGKQD